MRTPNRTEKAEQVKTAAIIFARMTRDANQIADVLQVTPRTIYRLMDREDFHEELDVLGYTGDRNFHPATSRQRHPDHDRAKRLWDSLFDVPRRMRGRRVAEELGVPIGRVWSWMRNWEETSDIRIPGEVDITAIQKIIDITETTDQDLIISLTNQNLIFNNDENVLENVTIEAIRSPQSSVLAYLSGTARIGDQKIRVIYSSKRRAWILRRRK